MKYINKLSGEEIEDLCLTIGYILCVDHQPEKGVSLDYAGEEQILVDGWDDMSYRNRISLCDYSYSVPWGEMMDYNIKGYYAYLIRKFGQTYKDDCAAHLMKRRYKEDLEILLSINTKNLNV